MNYLSIDYLIVGAFLLVTLLVGLWAGRGIKDIREYAIANKQIGTGVLTMTILATYITGSKGIGYVGHVFDNGIIPILPVLFCGVICCFLFIIKFIAPRIHHFSGCLTAAELMGKFYGYHARLVIAILGVFYAITLVIRQISWLSAIGELLSIPPNLAIVFIGFFLISYAAQGGMKAVTTTDVMQFIAIVVMVPLVAYVVLYRVGGIRALLNALPSGALDITHHPNFRGYLSHSVWNLFPAFPLSFPFIQRMLMAKDKQQLVNSYYVVMTCLVIVFLLFTLIGLGAIAMRTGGDVNVPAKGSKVFFYVVKNYFSTSGQGLIAVGMIAGVMSTADSFLHAAGLMLAHDVVQPFCAKKKLEINELTWARVGTCFTGILALWGAYNYQVLPHIKYAGVSLNETLNVITRPVALLFTIPLIAGIMGLKTDARSFFISCIATITVFITSQFCLDPSLVIPCCIVTNALSFFGAHYFHNQGFAVVKRVATQQEAHVWRPSWQGSSKRLNSLLPTPQKLLHYSQDKLAKYGANSTLFALFMAFNYMAPFFMHSYASPAAYSCLLVIRGMGALLCVGLLLKEVWPARLVPYFASYYHFSLLYCLPFVTTFLFFLEGSSIHWLINVCLSIMLLIVLADWLTFILLSWGYY